MIGILIAALVALVLTHKSASTKAPVTTVSTGIPTGLGSTPMPALGVLTREANGRALQTWQNWQQTTGTPVPVGSAADVLAPVTAVSDTKLNQQTQIGGGLTIINPTLSGVGSGQATVSLPVPGAVSSGGSLSRPSAGSGFACPIEGTNLEALGPSEIQITLLDETDWTIIEAENGDTLMASSSHFVYTRKGLTRLCNITTDDYVVTKRGESRIALVSAQKKEAKKMSIHIPDGHLYFAGGILSHNSKALTP